MDILSINSFLKYGYFIDYNKDNYPITFKERDSQEYYGMSECDLISESSRLFKSAIEINFERNKRHVLPLSGGLDSRAILGGLLEFTEAKNIHTYTFGTPGTLDFDIGCQIAKTFGTNHTQIILANHIYNQDEMLETSKRVDMQTVLFHHPPISLVDEIVDNGIVWSGYIGDLIVGGHQPSNGVSSLIEAKKRYLHMNQFVTSIDLTGGFTGNYIDSINFKELNKDFISYEEQVLLMERIPKLTAPHVLMKGYNYKTPFINNEFMDFFINLPKKYRAGESLFIKSMLSLYPELFLIRSKTSGGLSLTSTAHKIFIKKVMNRIQRQLSRKITVINNPLINYMDFNRAIFEKEDFFNVIHQNIKDLLDRRIITWIDIEAIWSDHLKKRKNHSNALLILASLELNLKVKDLTSNLENYGG